MSARGRRAALPGPGPKTERGLLAGGSGLVVRCFNQDGDEHFDFDFAKLTMAPALRDVLMAAFIKRVAPGAGLTAMHSIKAQFAAIAALDRHLAGLDRPPRSIGQLTARHIDGLQESREHLAAGHNAGYSALRKVLLLADGITDSLAARLGAPLPKRPRTDPTKANYSQHEIKRIAEKARGCLRAAAKRIRANRELLDAHRGGRLDVGTDELLARRLELLEWVDRYADVPRFAPTKEGCVAAGRRSPQSWVARRGFGTVKQVVSWLHLTVDELAAGAVLLAVMTGENPEVIEKVPAVHLRADGYTGEPGTAIVGLRKPRRFRRAFMDVALTEIPDWISIPQEPGEISARDELHTPFGLYILLHELTARSRQMAGGNRLLVGYACCGGRGVGRGVRPLFRAHQTVSALGREWGLMTDARSSAPAQPLALRLDLLRLSYLELHQEPVAQTEQTLASTYLARNRGNVAAYRGVVAKALAAEVDKARARGTMATFTTEDVRRALADPGALAAEHGVDPATLRRMLAGQLDTVLGACVDHKNGPHAPPGESCRASFMMCLSCPCARALPRHLPVQVLVHDALVERRGQMNALAWAERFAGPHAQIVDILDRHGPAAVDDARGAATDRDRAVVGRFLNRELDLR